MQRNSVRDLLEKRSSIIVEMRSITNNPAGSGGDISDEQEKRFTELMGELSSLEKRIERQQILDNAERSMTGEPISGKPSSAVPELRKMGEWLQHVRAVGDPGSGLSTRAAGQNESTPSEGGFLVSNEFSTSLLGDVFGTSQIAPLVRRMTISTGANGIDLPMIDETSRVDGSRHGGAAANWVGEGSQITSSKVKFRNVAMKLKKLASVYYCTDELLEDAPLLAAALRSFYASEIAFSLDDAIVNGTGAGMPLGILNSSALVTVSKEAGQVADSIAYENLVKMWSRLWPRGRTNAVWLTGPGVETQLYQLTLTIGTAGQPVFLPSGGASMAPFASLFGRPIIPCEQCPKLGDKGDILLIDPSQYLLVDKGSINEASSIGVRFEYAETAFRAVYRCDGAPTWASAVTQHSSTDTVSPFVCIEAR
mgnify:CR=1 FL=1